eukprot:s3204_g14.t1
MDKMLLPEGKAACDRETKVELARQETNKMKRLLGPGSHDERVRILKSYLKPSPSAIEEEAPNSDTEPDVEEEMEDEEVMSDANACDPMASKSPMSVVDSQEDESGESKSEECVDPALVFDRNPDDLSDSPTTESGTTLVLPGVKRTLVFPPTRTPTTDEPMTSDDENHGSDDENQEGSDDKSQEGSDDENQEGG